MRDAVGDNDDLRGVARDELPALGIPAPIRTLLETQLRPDHEDPPT
jgi:A/G-specific adenine glycosylase